MTDMNTIKQCVEQTWHSIAFDIPGDSVSADEMLELVIDANRFEMYGGAGAEQLRQMLDLEGYEKTVALIKAVLPFDQYEAGGAV
jgi:hypothetical protein